MEPGAHGRLDEFLLQRRGGETAHATGATASAVAPGAVEAGSPGAAEDPQGVSGYRVLGRGPDYRCGGSRAGQGRFSGFADYVAGHSSRGNAGYEGGRGHAQDYRAQEPDRA